MQDKIAVASYFTVAVYLKAEPPIFDIEGFTISPLTCTLADASWKMKLPPITTREISPVNPEIKINDIGAMFQLSSDEFVTLNEIGLETILTKEGCPTDGNLHLNFTLTSKLLGSNEQELEIPVMIRGDGSFFFGLVRDKSNSTNSGFGNDLYRFTYDENAEKLKVTEIKMRPYGELQILFSKPMIPLPFEPGSLYQGRNLQGIDKGKSSISLFDTVDLEIDDTEKVLDKSIASVEFLESSTTSINI